MCFQYHNPLQSVSAFLKHTVVLLQVGVSKAQRQKVTKLAECGWLYNKIRKYSDARRSDRAFGLAGQSFCTALHKELTEYYRLMSVLESQVRLMTVLESQVRHNYTN